MSEETIVLPRSGVQAQLEYIPCGEGAWVCRLTGCLTVEALTRETAIKRTDSRVLKLRATLMPADARELVASCVSDAELSRMAGTLPKHARTEGGYERYVADAVLAALGGDK